MLAGDKRDNNARRDDHISRELKNAKLPKINLPSDEYNPKDYIDPSTEIQPWMAYFNLVRTMCGTGLLGMPGALSASGVIIGAAFIAIISVTLIHTHHILLNSLNQISSQMKEPNVSYRDGLRLALLHGPSIWHYIGKRSPIIVPALMITSQVGICTVYVITTADSLRDILDTQSSRPACLILFPWYILMAIFMKSFRIVTYVGFVGNTLNMIGMVLILYHIFKEPLKQVTWVVPDVGGWLFTTGICMFHLSAVGVILSIDRSIRNQSIMTKTFGVVNIGLGIPAVCSLVFGFLGHWSFGATEDNIIRCLPYEDMTAMIAMAVYLVSVALTYPLQCYPAIATIIEMIKYRSEVPPSDHTLYVIDMILRPLFVCLTFLIALYVKHSATIVALVGHLCTSMLSIVFPVMMDISLRYQTPQGYGPYHVHLVKDLVIMICGIITSIFGVYFCGYLIRIRYLFSHSPNADEFI